MILKSLPKTKHPCSGIDKVRFVLNPIIVDSTQKNRYPYFDQKKEITIHTFGAFVYVEVHAEYFNPMLNYKQQIANVVIQLAEQGIITWGIDYLEKAFIYEYLDYFVFYIAELEFFFDFMPQDIVIDENENDPDVSDDEKVFKHPYKTTYYTKGTKDNIGIIYDRHEKLKHTNQTTHKKIEDNPYSIRLEFRLSRNNCRYLSLENIDGTYDEIFNKYLLYISGLYSRYFDDGVYIQAKKYFYFNKIYQECKKRKRVTRDNLSLGTLSVEDKKRKEKTLLFLLSNRILPNIASSKKEHI
jgi:hypothetical protein